MNNKIKKTASFLTLCFMNLFVLCVMGANKAFAITMPSLEGLDKYFIHFVVEMGPSLIRLSGIVAWFIGLIMEMCALLRITKPGFAHGKGTPSGTIAMLLVGAMLMSLPSTINAFESSIFGATQTEMEADQVWVDADLTYMGGSASGTKEDVLKAINGAFQYIRILGLIAFIRGLYLLKQAVDGGQASMLNSSMHIFGGVLAMNVAPVIRIFHTSVGTNQVATSP